MSVDQNLLNEAVSNLKKVYKAAGEFDYRFYDDPELKYGDKFKAIQGVYLPKNKNRQS